MRPGFRVLVVEDHPTMRSALRAILEAEAYRVREVGDGRSALDEVTADPPDLLILDLNIPVVSGDEVLRIVKADPLTSGIPVVVVTAEGEEGRAAAVRRGADGYVTKPFGPAVLLAALEQALGGSGSPATSP
jgi:CheY-like chemotaxis protein